MPLPGIIEEREPGARKRLSTPCRTQTAWADIERKGLGIEAGSTTRDDDGPRHTGELGAVARTTASYTTGTYLAADGGFAQLLS